MGPEQDTPSREERLRILYGEKVGVFTPFVVPTAHITTPAVELLFGMELPVRRCPLGDEGHDYEVYSRLGYIPNLQHVPIHVYDAMCALMEYGYEVSAQQLEAQVGPDSFVYIYANEGDLLLNPVVD